MSEIDVSLFEKVQAQMHGIYNEIVSLSKKKPDDPINKFKLKFVNQIVAQANSFLGKENIPFTDFEQFDEDSLPTNSDIVIILSQYLNCLEKLRSDNIKFDFGKWYWIIDGKLSGQITGPPHKLKL